jgi:hypothetical protein
MTDNEKDDEAERRRRAEALRKRVRELTGKEPPPAPTPPTPREFTDHPPAEDEGSEDPPS